MTPRRDTGRLCWGASLELHIWDGPRWMARALIYEASESCCRQQRWEGMTGLTAGGSHALQGFRWLLLPSVSKVSVFDRIRVCFKSDGLRQPMTVCTCATVYVYISTPTCVWAQPCICTLTRMNVFSCALLRTWCVSVPSWALIELMENKNRHSPFLCGPCGPVRFHACGGEFVCSTHVSCG